MTVPRVMPRSNGRPSGLYARPGLVIATSPRNAVWIDLDDAHALADALVDAAEAMEARRDAARVLDGKAPRPQPPAEQHEEAPAA